VKFAWKIGCVTLVPLLAITLQSCRPAVQSMETHQIMSPMKANMDAFRAASAEIVMGTNQVNLSADELSRLAEQLKRLVGNFQV